MIDFQDIVETLDRSARQRGVKLTTPELVLWAGEWVEKNARHIETAKSLGLNCHDFFDGMIFNSMLDQKDRIGTF